MLGLNKRAIRFATTTPLWLATLMTMKIKTVTEGREGFFEKVVYSYSYKTRWKKNYYTTGKICMVPAEISPAKKLHELLIHNREHMNTDT